MAHAPSGTCFTRHLEQLTIAHEFASALALLRRAGELMGIEWFNCEGLERRHAIGLGTLVVLDAIISGNYVERRKHLVAAVGEPLSIERKPPERAVSLAPPFSAAESLTIYHHLREINRLWGCDFYEGVVMKRGNADYPVQIRSGT